MFSYLADKIRAAEIAQEPFPHILIENFLSDEHFQAVVRAPEIDLRGFGNDGEMFDTLFAKGYKIIDFPGCITDKAEYMKWHRAKGDHRGKTNTACEGFGVTVRLMKAESTIIRDLIAYVSSEAFLDALAGTFAINRDLVFSDNGLHKYLDGYEISPHPDIRKKALTYMVNINPGADTEANNHHTHYLKFRDEYDYVRRFWDGNPRADRCWVPWSWCETKTMQRQNNSIVIFSPSNKTLHGVKAAYNHFTGQRTQLYGNFWYKSCDIDCTPAWEDFAIADAARAAAQIRKYSVRDVARAVIPKPVWNRLKALTAKDADTDTVISDRLKASKPLVP